MRALVLGGGGNKGSIQPVILKHLTGTLGIKYDIMCGVSVGALNAAFMGMFRDSNQGANELFDYWSNLTTSKVYKRWFPFGSLHALWKNSIYNSKPLQNTIRKFISVEGAIKSGKKIGVGTVSLNTGEYKIFTPNDHNFIDAVIASASFPGALNPITMNNELWTDGGVKHITPMKAAIEMGADKIDVILCTPEMTTNTYDSRSSVPKLVFRTLDLMTDQIVESDLQLAYLYNRLAMHNATSKRYIQINLIRPEFDLTYNSLNFDNKELKRMMSIADEMVKKLNIVI